MRKKIVITGGAGMLASDLHIHLQSANGIESVPMSRVDLDVGDPSAVKRLLDQLSPDVVVHTAALHVDDCERNPKEAMRINAWASGNLATACERSGAVFVLISTCGMFGDEVKAYSEYDVPTPKTVYARSKVAAEEAVKAVGTAHLIIRPGWLFGGSPGHKKNFVARRFEEGCSTSSVKSVCDKHGSPTYTGDLARRIVELLDVGASGIYHVANEGGCTRAEYVRHILECYGLETEVEEVGSEYFPRSADVPNCEILTSFNASYLGFEPLPDWRTTLDAYIQTIRQ